VFIDWNIPSNLEMTIDKESTGGCEED